MAKRRKINYKNLALVIVCALVIIALIITLFAKLFSKNEDEVKKPTSNQSSVVEEKDDKPVDSTVEEDDQTEENSEENDESEETETTEETGDAEETQEETVVTGDSRFTDTSSYLLLANKKHKLPDQYKPSDLAYPEVQHRSDRKLLRWDAAVALEEMFAAAASDGVYPVVISGFRSQDEQSGLYNYYVQRDGVAAADTYSSRPGYSDHQTGLAADLGGQDSSYDLRQSFEETVEGQWLAAHAHEYGFIMRYPKGKQDITGYMYEPWHFRYVGVEEATKIYQTDPNESFEEYYGVEGGDYAD